MPGLLKPLGSGFYSRISAVAAGLGVILDDDKVRRIATWFDLIATWNAKVDLTAARGPDELADLMLADAVVLSRYATPSQAVVDVGSGAGGPGLGLALVRPDLTVTLVEPLQKRVAFLRTAVGQLTPQRSPGGESEGEPGGGMVRVVRSRGEEVAVAAPGFDAAVARATLAPSEWLALGAELVHPEGVVWALLAREAPPEKEGWAIERDESYQWPLTQAKRRAVAYRRVAPPPQV